MITARYHREIPQRYRLEAGKCSACGHIDFPPRLVCPQCKGRTFTTIKLSDEGTLETFTVIRVGSEKFSRETPYAVGIVSLIDGVKISAQIADVDVDSVRIGQKVKVVFRRIQEDGKAGILCYGYKVTTI